MSESRASLVTTVDAGDDAIAHATQRQGLIPGIWWLLEYGG